LNTPLITDIDKISKRNDNNEKKRAERAKNNERQKIFQQIGQQEFEDVVFTPEKRQKKSRNKILNGNENMLSSNNIDFLSSNLDVNHVNINKITTIHSPIMQLSFDDNFISKSDRDLEMIQRDVENKEKLLADVLDFDLSKYMTNNRINKDESNDIPTRINTIMSINCNIHCNNIRNEEQSKENEDIEQIDCTEIESGDEDVSYRTELKRLEDLGECRKILLQKLDYIPVDNNSIDIQQIPPTDRNELEYQFNCMY